MRIRWKVVAPALAAVGSWLASPHALSLVSEEHSHILLAVSSLILIVTPALVTNKPSTKPRARVEKQKLEERLNAAGLKSREAPLPPNSLDLPHDPTSERRWFLPPEDK
jgi:hypothetical protein